MKRKPRVVPVHGTTKLVEKFGVQFLQITRGKKTVEYRVVDHKPDPRVAFPAFKLVKEDGESYDVGMNEFGPFCSCPDSDYRRRACKHLKAAQAVGLIPREPEYEANQAPPRSR
jgi:hypothetical protein